METQEKMTGLWLTYFSNSKSLADGAKNYINPSEILKKIAALFNDCLSTIEYELGGKFKDGAFVEAKHIDPDSDEGSVYLSFPDFSIDCASHELLEKNIKYSSEYFENIDELKCYLELISTIRIDINPCLYQNFIGKSGNHKTKIYVIPWHVGDLATDKINKFLKISMHIAEGIAENIRQKYSDFICRCDPSWEEINVNSKIITGVYYNSDIEKLHETLFNSLNKDNSIKRDQINRLWKPFFDFGADIFAEKNTINKVDAFFHKSNFMNKPINGIYGITGGHDLKNDDVTYIFGVSPFPREATFGVHKPIISQQ